MNDEPRQQRDHWRDPISDERKAQLTALADQQRAWLRLPVGMRGDSVFRGVHLTGADVFWLTTCAMNSLKDYAAVVLDGSQTGREYATYPFAVLLHLEGADLRGAHLEGAILDGAHLEATSLSGAHLEKAGLRGTHLEGASLHEAHLEGAALTEAYLEGVALSRAHLEGKSFPEDDPHLRYIRQTWPNFPAMLPPADLRGVSFDAATALTDIILVDARHGAVQVANVRWADVNLSVVLGWSLFTERHIPLGDEREAWAWKPTPFIESEEQSKRLPHQYAQARQQHTNKQTAFRLKRFQAAVRAYRQVAAALRTQGMNEQADYFDYRAQVVQREVSRQQGRLGQWLFSLLLWALSGYGFRLWRILAAYGVVLVVFSLMFWGLGIHSFPHESGLQALWDSFLVSLSAIHGRTTFERLGAWSPAAWVAALESAVGIVIEGVFVAMLVQRFFAR